MFGVHVNHKGSNDQETPTSCSAEESTGPSLDSLSSSNGAAGVTTDDDAMTTTSDSGLSSASLLAASGRGRDDDTSGSRNQPYKQENPSLSLRERSKIIQHPHPSDVLCGRGPGYYSHPGNIAFKKYVQERKAEYILASNSRGKTKITNEVLEKMLQLEPPSRFLERTANRQWIEVNSERRFSKTSQALREGAPTMRAKAVKILKDDNTSTYTTGNRCKPPSDLDYSDHDMQTRSLHAVLGLGTSKTSIKDMTPSQLKVQSEMVVNELHLSGHNTGQAHASSVSSGMATCTAYQNILGQASQPLPFHNPSPSQPFPFHTPASSEYSMQATNAHLWPEQNNLNTSSGYELALENFNGITDEFPTQPTPIGMLSAGFKAPQKLKIEGESPNKKKAATLNPINESSRSDGVGWDSTRGHIYSELMRGMLSSGNIGNLGEKKVFDLLGFQPPPSNAAEIQSAPSVECPPSHNEAQNQFASSVQNQSSGNGTKNMLDHDESFFTGTHGS